ncbi:hypothetical protein [Actinoplanes siamensis]|uniref:hypothetical protein n=1 Tax=Actinoplanes siamensis TaxID=1223317 RepID=UPI0019437B27|nr:hypothetical protein [Actinoplanes siamensis]
MSGLASESTGAVISSSRRRSAAEVTRMNELASESTGAVISSSRRRSAAEVTR